MPAHNIAKHLFRATEYPDPGASGTVTVDRNPCFVSLVSAAAETRTLAHPTRTGGRVFLLMKTDGGDITLTVTGGYNEDGDTTFSFTDAGQFVEFVACYDGTNYYWRMVSTHALGNLSALTATEAELNYLDQDLASNTLTRGAGVDTAESYSASISRAGGLAITRVVVDLTTLVGSATDLDIIGETGGAASCHFGQITTAKSGTLIGGQVTCLEVPAGGSTDIDFYSANESTGAQDALVTSLVETALVTAGGAWTAGASKGMTSLPPANDYLYIVNGAGAAGGTFTAGKFLIELYGTF